MLTNKNINIPNTPAVFKTRVLITYCMALFGLLICLWGIGILIILKGGMLSDLLIVPGLTLMLCLASIINIRATSDLIIDDNGITRVLFGKTVQVIRWDNIKKVHVRFYKKNPIGNKPGRGFVVYPLKSSRNRIIYKWSKMWFYDGFDECVEQFSELMSYYISKYNIKIYNINIDGSLTEISHI